MTPWCPLSENPVGLEVRMNRRGFSKLAAALGAIEVRGVDIVR